jgi:hypothetical protein
VVVTGVLFAKPDAILKVRKAKKWTFQNYP